MKALQTMAAGAMLSLLCSLASAKDGRQIELKIDAPTMAKALIQFSQQSGLQMIFPTDGGVARLPAPSVVGTFTPDAALDRLLLNSGLEYEFINAHTVSIRSTQSAKPSVGGRDANEPQTISVLNLAQADPQDITSATGAEAADSPGHPDSGANKKPLNEVVVTGSHIRGTESAGANLVVIDRDYIDKSGYSTVADVLKTLPQLGPSTATADYSVGKPNAGYGEGVDLRGLGLGTTLVLVNGRRQSSSGVYGNFTDISSIPLSAVERVEVLLDGASATYGSDAVGGVINLVLRKDFNGAETRALVGSYSADATELQASQTVGGSWSSGNALVGYQFRRQNRLAAADRRYAADSDQTRLGGDNFSSKSSNPGNILNLFTGETVAIPRGQDGTGLTAADFVPGTANYQNLNEAYSLVPQMKTHSAYFSASQKMGERLEFFADGRFTKREFEGAAQAAGTVLFVPSSNPWFVDPFNSGLGFDLVYYSFHDDFRATFLGNVRTLDTTAGLRLPLGAGWRAEVSGAYADERMSYSAVTMDSDALTAALADSNPASAFNPFGDGSNTNPATIAALRKNAFDSARSHTRTFSASADGPVGDLPGGSAKLAVGADYRTEAIPSTGLSLTRVSGLSRNVSSAFAELAIPIVGKANAISGVHDLKLSLAARYEDYSDFGSTTNPKVGLSWAPVGGLSFRGTWGTSFRAPNLTDLDPIVFNIANNIPFVNVLDPQSPTGFSNILLLAGVRDDLHEERARSWTAGFDVKPKRFPGLSISGTYTQIRYKDRIGSPDIVGGAFAVLAQEDLWYPIIKRDPSTAEIEALCNSPIVAGTPEACLATPYAAIVDLRKLNLAFTKLRSFDLQIENRLDVGAGIFTVGLAGTYNLDNEQAVTSDGPHVDTLDKLNGPLSLKLRARAGWSFRGFDVDAIVNYQPSYDDPVGGVSAIPRTIDSWTTLDVSAAYRFDTKAAVFKDTQIRLSVINTFDSDPPYANTIFGYDGANADPYGRLMSIELRRSW